MNKFAFQISRVKVKVTVAFLEKHCHHSSAFICKPILIKFHINMKYDNILHIVAF